MRPTVLLDHELALSQSGYTVRALLRFRGRAPSDSSRVPLNLALVLDRSGSMAGEPLAAAREAAAFLVRRLAPEDRVAVVAFDHEIETIAQPATGEAQAHLARRLETIEPGGSTNLSGGWLRGRELIAGAVDEGTASRVILLTDGHANAGITDHGTLAELCARAKRDGVVTTTIGFGAGYDERLLRGMSDAGGGSTYYIEHTDQATGVFEEEIEGLLTLAAQNLAVEVRPSSAVRLVAVHNDYPHSGFADGFRVELGDLYAREPKSLLVELFVPGLEEREETPVAEITVHAHVLTDVGGIERQEVRFEIRTPLAAAGHAEPEVRRELLLLQSARAREEALERRDNGDERGAAGVLREMSARLRSAEAAYGPAVMEHAADLEETADQLEAGVFGSADSKYLAQRAYNARRGKVAYEDKISRVRRKRGG